MSYSGGGSGKSFGNRGLSSQRKEKKKKQEFHKHHLKFTPDEHLSPDQLKERVSIGLQKLGTQVFSTEPGGYGFHNWMTSFNLLLDDFEEKCKPVALPKEYFDSRLELTARLLEPVDTSALDFRIKQLEEDIHSTEEKIAKLAENAEKGSVDQWHEDESKIGHLRKKRTQVEIEITTAKSNLEDEKKKAASQSVFKRLFSSSDALKQSHEKIDSLISKRDNIDEEIRLLEKDRVTKLSEVKKFHSEINSLRENLEELKLELGEVETQKQEQFQIVERRSEITKSMSDMISSLHLVSQTETEVGSDNQPQSQNFPSS